MRGNVELSTEPFEYSVDSITSQTNGMFSGLAAGEFTFTVRDAAGCTATASVSLRPAVDDSVTANIVAPVPGGEDDDEAVCQGEEIDLQADLVEGFSGQWTVSPATAGSVLDAQAPLTTAILNSPATLVWELSAPGCPAFSRDSIVLRTSIDLLARDDRAANARDQTINIAVLDNDRTGGQASTISISTEPRNGVATVENDGIVYTSERAGESDSLEYRICAVNCPDNCATAWVRIEEPISDPCDALETGDIPPSVFPEGLVLNSGTANERLYIRIIDPAVCPFLEYRGDIAVFNRWGDLIFQDDDYQNDWRGTAMNGQSVPPGTYYYVLRVEETNFNYVSPLYIFDAAER